MYTTEQVLMTLSALAPTGAAALPGETVGQQAARIAAGIAKQLAMPGLATAGEWTLRWVGLSDDRANLSYVASSTGNAFAVVLRGTIDSWTDIAEDLLVGTVVPFPQGGSATALIAQGAMDAFTEVTQATGQAGDGPLLGLTLVQALKALLVDAAPAPTLYVTGHSLGGALATTVSLYVQQQALRRDLAYQVMTFAAPTAGLAGFQQWYDGRIGDAGYRVYNAYDLVPLAFSDLPAATAWYPAPGPPATDTDRALIGLVDDQRDGHVYVQPTWNPIALNTDFAVHLPPTRAVTFAAEVAFQHHSTTYLTLLGAPLPPPWPAVNGVSPAAGGAAGGTRVTVVGSGFPTDGSAVAVYFGDSLATQVVVESDTRLTAVSPRGSGFVDVYVTTYVGTSPFTLSALFVYV